ncbi:hypothetical protein J1N35_007325 [Gossypium stocksii]|uniref:Reverse transcriptase zinc-binding domain-containing protein n=1 Tax=Gossypium stocksii TaxID=47602 RepID=A0A9D3W6U4_9ROSI|nr:hypothetical protein J1N35_007325 [Gossypium stocksii]
MKSKYYPQGEFMHAELGSYPSYTWRSIWGARHLLDEGIGWRIGDGKSINIWNDRWIPCPGNGRVRCQQIDIRYITVADLIDNDSNTWKQTIIRTLLGDEQLRSILSIPLVSSRPPDALVWRGDNTGSYTVKSGYKWIITEGGNRMHNGSTSRFFTVIWELKLPSKI